MSRTKRSLIAVAIAVVLAVLGSAAVLMYVRSADARAVAGREAVTVLVATKRIPAGTTGREVREGGYTEPVTMPATTVPSDALGTVDASLDALALTYDVQPRQLVLRGGFAADSRLAGGLIIPDGKIAITISTTSNHGTSFIRPGSKVALFSTYTLRDPSGGSRLPDGNNGPVFGTDANHVTRLLLPRVEVIAVGVPGEAGAETASGSQSQSAAAAAAQSTTRPTTMTFAVTQDEAERIIHATSTEMIYVALLDDTSDVRPGPGVDTKSLFP